MASATHTIQYAIRKDAYMQYQNAVNVTPMVSVPRLLICIQCMVKFIITLVSSNLSQDQQRHLHATKGTNYASVVICIVSFLFLLHLLLLTLVFSDLMIYWW